MKYWFQIHTGNIYEKSRFDLERIIRILGIFQETGQLAGVFAGWGADPAPYRMLSQTLRAWQVPFYFKTAVFSEIEQAPEFLLREDLEKTEEEPQNAPQQGITASNPDHENLNYEPMIGPDLNPVPPYNLNEQEHFLFRCPSSEKNLKISLDFALRFLDLNYFDGLFLDRIRYNSLISGADGIGCFCPRCTKMYRQRGIDVDKVRRLLMDAAQKKSGQPSLSVQPIQPVQSVQPGQFVPPVRYSDGIYAFEDADLNAFFKARADIIRQTVRAFAKEVQERRGVIGLDLFTPSAAYFTGQDVLSLSREVDFIKPMLYQFTKAPAGIPFEMPYVDGFVRRFDGKFQAKETLKGRTPREIFLADLELLKQASCQVYAGIDMNQIDPICRCSVEELSETLGAVQAAGFGEIVCSWNLEQIPDSHLAVLLNFQE